MKELPEIKKPVFILGPERSGTTLLYSLLANADEFYWFSRIDSLIPSWPYAAELSRRLFGVLEKPFIAHHGKISKIKGFNTPTECNAYWKQIFKWGDETNYLIENDRFVEDDLTNGLENFIKTDFTDRLSYSGKKRMLLKQPGFSLKLRFWNHIFPDAFFLICTRNIEDNVCSLIKAKKDSKENFWGTKVDEWRDFLDADYRTQSLLQLKKIYSFLAEDLKNEKIARQTMVVSFDQFLSDPEREIKKAVQFCKVRWNKQMRLASKGIVRQNPPPDCNVDYSVSTLQIVKQFEKKASDLYAQQVSE